MSPGVHVPSQNAGSMAGKVDMRLARSDPDMYIEAGGISSVSAFIS